MAFLNTSELDVLLPSQREKFPPLSSSWGIGPNYRLEASFGQADPWVTSSKSSSEALGGFGRAPAGEVRRHRGRDGEEDASGFRAALFVEVSNPAASWTRSNPLAYSATCGSRLPLWLREAPLTYVHSKWLVHKKSYRLRE
jgi:hypothetical protein